jgi:PAS domain S-box-containing protein
MTLLSFISAFGTFLSTIIGSFTLRENSRSFQNRLFAVLCFTVGYISFTEFGYRQAETPEMADFWFKLSLITPILIPIMLHFILIFTRRVELRLLKVILILSYLSGCFFIIIDFFTGTISGKPAFSIYGWDHNPVVSTWYQIYTGWSLLMYITISILITQHYLQLKPSADKTRAKYTMYAFMVISTLAITTERLFPFIEFEFPELSTLGFLIGNLLVGYAMWKYKLLRISPVNAAENIVETMSDSLFLIDPNGTIVSANSAAEVMLGMESKQLVNIHIDSLFFDPDSRKEFLTVSKNWQKPLIDHSSQFRTLDGKQVPVSISVSILTDSTGNISGIVAIARNITERLAAQKALENANLLLEQRVAQRTEELSIANFRLAKERDQLDITLQSIGDAVIVISTESKIELLNKKAEKIIGNTSAEIKDKHIQNVYCVMDNMESQKHLDPVGDTLRSGEWLEHSAVLCISDSYACQVEGSTAPIRDEANNILGCVLVFRDCTEKHALQKELFKIRRLESIGALAGGIAHDFESILNKITNNLLLIKLLSNQTPDTVSLINSTEEMAIGAQKLTKKLSSFSGNNNKIEPEQIESVKEMINDSIGFMITDNSIDYEVSVDEDLMNVKIWKSDFQTIFSSLVTNALEAVHENGFISIDAHNLFIDESKTGINSILHGYQLSPGWYVKVTIHDNGPGISNEIREKAFDPFFSTKKEKQGLGLSVAHSLVRKKGGAIFFEPNITEGCSVSFILSSTDLSTSDQMVFSQNDLLIEENSYLRGKLLLIENNLEISSQISDVLSSAGFDIVDTDNITRGIHYFNEAMTMIPFDSILCSSSFIDDPGMLNIIGRMRVLKQPLRIIVINRHNGSAQLPNVPKGYFDSIITAPLHCKKLISIIKTTLLSL